MQRFLLLRRRRTLAFGGYSSSRSLSTDNTPTPPKASEAKDVGELGDDVITPWSVAAKGPSGVNYDRVLTKFKAERVDATVLTRMAEVAARRAERLGVPAPPVHHFFTRGIVFSHRDFGIALDDIEASFEPGKHTSFLYTGRGPSAGTMHAGHVLPFLLTKYLQDTFGLPLVIQITDDEKYLFRDIPFDGEKADTLINNNIKDIIAFGFNPRNTFIFRNSQYMGEMYPTVLKMQHALTANSVKNTLGLSDSDNVGKFAFPAVQAAPCFGTAFRRVLQVPDPRHKLRCLIPCAIDQDPFFVLTRNAAPKLKALPPALLHTKFLPALKGLAHKMSSSAAENGVIMLTDTDKQVRKKMRRAFSGGSGTLEEMQAHGADLDVDVAYQVLRYFCPDDELFATVTTRYSSGQMNSGEVKDLAADVLIEHVLKDWRARRALVTDDDVVHFCSIRNLLL